MSADRVLEINHRELILSSSKKRRFRFLRMHTDLQNQIIEGLDNRIMTLKQASHLAQQHGFEISYEAISGYYEAVRRRRDELLFWTIR